MWPCLACRVGQHQECDKPFTLNEDETKADECCCMDDPPADMIDSPKLTIIGGYKANEEVMDPTSTGRKRAAKLKPIIPGMTCEWAGLLSAGGGVFPIVGCDGVTLTPEKGNKLHTGNVHHGPDKSTLNNTANNLHAVCGRCHHRWHTLNDPYYPKDRPANGAPFLPTEGEMLSHDRYTLATDAQKQRSEEWWEKYSKTDVDYRDFVMGEYDG